VNAYAKEAFVADQIAAKKSCCPVRELLRGYDCNNADETCDGVVSNREN